MQLNYGRPTIWTFAHFLIAQCGVVWSSSSSSSFEGSSPVAAGAQRCHVDDDCDTSLGQKCYRLYDECRVGQCMCNPKQHRHEPSGNCTPVRHGNERCSETIGDCVDGMSCIGGYCRCKLGTMTSDGQFCLLPGQRLLGQKCRPPGVANSCLRKSSTGYTRYDVRCSAKGECECANGYKAEGITCRRWNVNEFGCQSTHHCQGGAICSDGQCVCPPDYIAIAGNTKCAKLGGVWIFRSPRRPFCGSRIASDAFQCDGKMTDGLRRDRSCCVHRADGRTYGPCDASLSFRPTDRPVISLIDLPSGDICDEINELRYCARSLICYKCSDEEVFKCVSFLMVSEYSYLSSVASVSARQLTYDQTLLIPSFILLQLLTNAAFHSPR